MMKWKSRDVVAVALTLAVVLVLVGTGLSGYFHGQSMSDEQAQLLAVAFGSVVSIVAGYVSRKVGDDD